MKKDVLPVDKDRPHMDKLYARELALEFFKAKGFDQTTDPDFKLSSEYIGLVREEGRLPHTFHYFNFVMCKLDKDSTQYVGHFWEILVEDQPGVINVKLIGEGDYSRPLEKRSR